MVDVLVGRAYIHHCTADDRAFGYFMHSNRKKNKKLIVIPTLTGFYVRLRYVNIVQGQTLNSYNSSNVQLSVGLRYSNSHQFGMWFVTNVAANNIVVLQQ